VSAAAFYCVADERYFLGAVGLVNGLRVLGHAEPIYVLDHGLTARQRDLLAREVTLVPGPKNAAPWLLKTLAPRAHRHDVMVLIDADMIATRSLEPVIERAREGVVAFRNDRDRFVAEWGELLDLGPVRRQPYVSSALFLLGGEVGAGVLELLDDRQRHVDIELGVFGRNLPGYPFVFPEQDVLNAILGTSVDRDRVTILDQRLTATPPFRGLRIEQARTLRCVYRDGSSPYALHHFARKPWLVRMRSNVYSRLLTRLLLGHDVSLRLEPAELPLRLRTGAAAQAARLAVDYGVGAPSYVRRRLRAARGHHATPFAAIDG
jgi:hypothetical protein